MKMLEFDHLFVLTQPQAPEVDVLIAKGFSEGSRNLHMGQGTANRRIFCHNAMVEFLWIRDAAETKTPAIAPMQFLARSNYRQTGYSPFGIALRYQLGTTTEARAIPFDTWDYHPPYLPTKRPIKVAHTLPQEPLIFILPFDTTRPDQYPPAKRQPLDHVAAVKEITALKVTLPTAEPLSPALEVLQAATISSFGQGSAPLLAIEFDSARQNQLADCRPAMPLLLQY